MPANKSQEIPLRPFLDPRVAPAVDNFVTVNKLVKPSPEQNLKELLERAPRKIPHELQILKQWCVWKYETRDGKPTKVPYDPRTGLHLKTNTASTWSTFDEAIQAISESDSRYSGIGFVFSADDPYWGVDLDNCLIQDAASNAGKLRLKSWAKKIVNDFNTYVEISPSGTGLKLIGRGELPAGFKSHKKKYHDGDVEIYQNGRYFTITGKVPKNFTREVTDCAQAVAKLIDNLGEATKRESKPTSPSTALRPASPPTSTASPDDQTLLNKARAAQNGAEFDQLWNGDWEGKYRSHSEADLALCGMLAFWVGPDEEGIDRLFRQSGLIRDKWDEQHSSDGTTYGAGTIAKALKGKIDFYDWHNEQRKKSAENTLQEVIAAVKKAPHTAIADILRSDEKVSQVAEAALALDSKYRAMLLDLPAQGAAIKAVTSLGQAINNKVKVLKQFRKAEFAGSEDSPYHFNASGISLVRYVDDRMTSRPLSNFTAEILEDINEDDGADQTHKFRIKVTCEGVEQTITVPAEEFDKMKWPIAMVGANAIIHSGQGNSDHVRAAIQFNSKDHVKKKTVYKHLGWRDVNGKHVFLHAGGAIGSEGALPSIEVLPPDKLSKYELPPPPKGPDLIKAIRRSLELPSLVKQHAIGFALLGATFRAPLGGVCDSTVFLAGSTGTGKSVLTSLYQQHYGPAMDRLSLPANWASTGNALEGIAYAAKDCMLTIDDFCPVGTPYEIQGYHKNADRLIRAQRNGGGRQRMQADGNLRTTKYPRGIIVATGEDVPTGHSLRASMMIFSLEKGDLDFDKLATFQKLGSDGVFAKTMSAYVAYIARNYDAIQAKMKLRLNELRAKATESTVHRRTPELVANLMIGIEVFLEFAFNSGALSQHDCNRVREIAWGALGQAAAQQAAYQQESDPASRFMELIRSSLSSGQAHLAGANGQKPDEMYARACGWRNEGSSWLPQGVRIGWIDMKAETYLDPQASYRVAQEAARNDVAIPVQSKTLHKRLHEAGWLSTINETRNRLTTRKQLQGTRREVLHIMKGQLLDES